MIFVVIPVYEDQSAAEAYALIREHDGMPVPSFETRTERGEEPAWAVVMTDDDERFICVCDAEDES